MQNVATFFAEQGHAVCLTMAIIEKFYGMIYTDAKPKPSLIAAGMQNWTGSCKFEIQIENVCDLWGRTWKKMNQHLVYIYYSARRNNIKDVEIN